MELWSTCVRNLTPLIFVSSLLSLKSTEFIIKVIMWKSRKYAPHFLIPWGHWDLFTFLMSLPSHPLTKLLRIGNVSSESCWVTVNKSVNLLVSYLEDRFFSPNQLWILLGLWIVRGLLLSLLIASLLLFHKVRFHDLRWGSPLRNFWNSYNSSNIKGEFSE